MVASPMANGVLAALVVRMTEAQSINQEILVKRIHSRFLDMLQITLLRNWRSVRACVAACPNGFDEKAGARA
jgi:hypothetical protein